MRYTYRRHISKKREAARKAALDRQVQFAWDHREHFEAARLHNIETSTARKRGGSAGSFRNAWEELGYQH